MDAPLPSSSHAPSIWYEDVATPQRNPSGSRRSLDVADSVATACSRPRGEDLARRAGRHHPHRVKGDGRQTSTRCQTPHRKCNGFVSELTRRPTPRLRPPTVSSMARQPRIEVPGGIYHVGSRGNRGCVIYEDDFERRMFLRLLSLVARRFGWTCHAYVLMSNHFHLLIQLAVGGLSAGLQLLDCCLLRLPQC